VEFLMASKLKQVAAKLKEPLRAKVIHCQILDRKVKDCKITTCEFYRTCHRKEKQPRP
jgi:hypothetical protein